MFFLSLWWQDLNNEAGRQRLHCKTPMVLPQLGFCLWFSACGLRK